MIRSRMVLACSLLALCSAAVATVPESLLQPLQWRSIGPFRGGRVLTATGVPGQPAHFYFGAVNGGVWETLDAGRTWQPIFDSQDVGSIGALAVAPSDPKTLYVGTGEADMRSDIAQGVGLFKSIDGGHSWQSIGLEDSQQIGRILVDPAHPDRLLVAALGHPYGPNDTRGVFRSTDGGKTWERTLFRDHDTGAIDLAFQPGNADIVYATLWQTRRPPWSVYPPSSGPGGGLFKSIDGGRTWTELSGHGLPAHPGRIGLAVTPAAPQRIYALVDVPNVGGLYRSDNGGADWTRVSGDSRLWKRGWYFGGVTAEPGNADIVYVCNTTMYRSDDGGKTFAPVKGAPGGDDYHALWIDPAAPQRRILATDQGALVSENGGASWSSWYNQPTGQFYHVITDNRFPYTVYGAQQDSGAAGVPSRTGNIDGINLRQFHETQAGGESDNIAPDPDDPDLVFGGRVDVVDGRTGQTRNISPGLGYPDIDRATWTLPLVFGTAGEHALYFGNQRVYRTSDRGNHWRVISPDLSRENPGVPANLDATTAADVASPGVRRGVVYAIGPSPLDGQLIWAGTDDGLVWRTRDGGTHWDPVTPAALQAWSKVGVVEASHFDRDTAYIAVDRHRLDDFRPYIYRTHDGGGSWALIGDGIHSATGLDAVNVVREDPEVRGLLYAGTESGVYVSFDDGAHWQSLQRNLPRTSVRDLQVHGSDLVIATHGRGFWIMDDAAPLRRHAANASLQTRLLPPSSFYRERPTGFTGTPMPLDEPRGLNPPAGAAIDYVLESDATAPVTLSIEDAQGAVVRRFSSSDRLPSADPAKMEIAAEWIQPSTALSSRAGAHRFFWDLHYPPPAPVEPDKPFESDPGVWAPPGLYQVVLQVGAQQYRQPLKVLPDPRVKLPPTAYAVEFALARRVEDQQTRVDKALNRATSLHAAIRAHAVSPDAATAAAMAEVDRRILEISDIPADPATRALFPNMSPTTTAGLRYLSAQLQAMKTAVDGADAAPSSDVRSGFDQLALLSSRALEQWAELEAGALAALDARLKQQGEAPLTGP